MADSLNTPTLPKTRSISAICRDWRISLACCNLECEEAGDDEILAAATDRESERAAALLDEIQEARPENDAEILDIVSLAVKLLKSEGEREVIAIILRRAFHGPHPVSQAGGSHDHA